MPSSLFALVNYSQLQWKFSGTVPFVTKSLAGIFLRLFIWATAPLKTMINNVDHALKRMAEETSFILIGSMELI